MNKKPEKKPKKTAKKNSLPSIVSQEIPQEIEPEKKEKINKLPPGVLDLQFAGELIIAKCLDKRYTGYFEKFGSLFETLANIERKQRLLNYKIINCLMLTSYAKKATEKEKKKQLFDLKNEVFLSLANNKAARRLLTFRYLSSKNFLVEKFCEDCQKKNEESQLPRHTWKFCEKCQVNREFYNVLAMENKFTQGSMIMFLSQDQLAKLKNPNIKIKDKLENYKEGVFFKNFRYYAKNFDVFKYDSIIKMHEFLKTKEIEE